MDIRQEIPIKSLAIAAYVCKLVNGVCKHLIIWRSSGHLGGTGKWFRAVLNTAKKAGKLP